MLSEKEQIVKSLSPPLPQELVEELIDEYLSIKDNFFLGRLGPSELNAGRFCEITLRIIEHLHDGQYTDMGDSLNKEELIDSVEEDTSLPDGIRLYIPRLCRSLYDIRNNRDVAHVRQDIDPNKTDSLLVSHAADWILTELIRNYYPQTITPEKAKSIVLKINEINIPLVQKSMGEVKVQRPDMSYDDQVLAILYHEYPAQVSDDDLYDWTGYSVRSTFKESVLNGLDQERKIFYKNGMCQISNLGRAYVEKHIDMELAP
jgi:hypothetical protein